MNNKKDNGFTTGFWILEAVLFFSGCWFIAIPILLIKLFAPDQRKSERRQAPPLYSERSNTTYTTQRRTASSVNQRANTGTYNANTDVRGTYRAPTAEGTNYKTGGGSYNYTASAAAASRNRANARANTASGAAPKAEASKAESAVRSFTKTPSSSKGSIIALIVIGAMITLLGLGGISVGLDAISEGIPFLSDLLGGIATVAGGLCCFGASWRLSAAKKRYANYFRIIGSTTAVEISSIAKKAGVSEKRALKDLEKMVEKGFFGDSAYINYELGYLFRSTSADDELRHFRDEALKKQEEIKQEQMAGTYANILKQIRDVNDRIAHTEMTAKIYRIEEVTRQIFQAVEKDENKKPRIARFMNYYLPTTLKLLESYAELEKASIGGENIDAGKASIEGAMDSIVTGFENQLDELYKEDAFDISSDVDVMKTMLERDNPNSAFKAFTSPHLTEKQKQAFDAAAEREKAQREAEARAAILAEENRLAAEAAQAAMDTRTQFEKDFGIKSPSQGLGSGAAAQAYQEKQE